MCIIDFTPQSLYIDETTQHNHTKPVLECSTIKARIYNASFTKSNNKYTYNDTEILVQWYDGYCGWIKIEDEYFDNQYIPLELLIQISEFMLDNNNYITCNLCHN
jgi:hypothetical protein